MILNKQSTGKLSIYSAYHIPFIILNVAADPKFSELTSEMVLPLTLTMYTTSACSDDSVIVVDVIKRVETVVGASSSL